MGPRGQLRRERRHCRADGRETDWLPAGADGGNELGPRIVRWRCASCGLERDAYGNVHDTEGLARAVLGASLDGRGAGRVGPLGDPVAFDGLDYADALGQLRLALWVLWTRWDQSHGDGTGSFLGLATQQLRLRLIDWYREQHVMTRDGRSLPESVSLERLVGDAGSDRPVAGGLERALAEVPGYARPDRSPDLTRALSRAGRGADGPL